MKQYIKDNEIKYADEILIYSGDYVMTNPPEDRILADGWVEYIAPKPTEEDILNIAKLDKIQEIKNYDSSIQVNEFTYNGYKLWLNREERLLIKDRFEREIKNNVKVSHIYYQGQEIIINPTEGLKLINDVCDYADASFDVTLKHIYNVNRLTSISEIEQYNYKADYPSKLNLL